MKILIIQTAFIGDVILATPLIEKLHQYFPDIKIDFLLRKGNESLLDNHPYINKILVFDKKKNIYKGGVGVGILSHLFIFQTYGLSPKRCQTMTAISIGGLNTSPKLGAYIPHLSNHSCSGAYDYLFSGVVSGLDAFSPYRP